MGDTLEPTCPAVADAVGSTTGTIPTIVCGVLVDANRGAEIGGFTERGFVSPRQDGRDDWKTVVSLCCGEGVPAIEDRATPHYTACPLWRARREADWERRAELHDRAHREAVLPRQNPDRVRRAIDALKAAA